MNYSAILIATTMLLLQLLQIAMAAAVSSDANFETIDETGHDSGGENNNDKVIRIHMHPTSSYVRWLQLQLDDIDAKLSLDSNDVSASHSVKDGSDEKKGGALRRQLKEDEIIISSNSESEETSHNHNEEELELQHERELLQQQLDDAISSLQGSSSAYATLMEFPTNEYDKIEDTVIKNEENRDTTGSRQRRRAQTQQQSLQKHNEMIQEYNDNYRRYSKYEWDIREEGRTEDEEKVDSNRRRLAYQTSPLHQGYGTHYAYIWVGTPPQRKTVIIDTGSHYTAFPCKGCINCGLEHHADPYFDFEASTTFRALKCNECSTDSTCENNQCVFNQVYTEGSSWHAFESLDKVFLGGKELSSALNPINNSFKTDFMFGCQMKETGLFVTQLADGIMGMSAHPSTLPRAMYEQGKLEHNMFSMCFRRELHVSKQGIVAGMLTLGGIDNTVDLTPMVYARNVAPSEWFTVFVKNVYIREQGGQRAKADGLHQKLHKVDLDLNQINGGRAILDSGTTDTYLHESIAEPFSQIWERVTGKPYSNSPVKIDKKDILQLPTVLIQMQEYDGLAGEIDISAPQDVILAFPATHYMEYSASEETYTPRIYFTSTFGGVIGTNAMQGHNVLFDWENKRVGFAESACEYQEQSKAITEEDCRRRCNGRHTVCGCIDAIGEEREDDASTAVKEEGSIATQSLTDIFNNYYDNL